MWSTQSFHPTQEETMMQEQLYWGRASVSVVQHLLSNSSQKGTSGNKHRNKATKYDAPHHDALPASYDFQLKNFPNPVWFAC